MNKNKILGTDFGKFIFLNGLLNFLYIFFLKNYLLSQETQKVFTIQFSRDISRFFGLELSFINSTYFVSIFICLLSLVSIFSSNWFNNLELYSQSNLDTYLRIFISWNFVQFTSLYYFRVYSISRLYLLIVTFLIPLVILFFIKNSLLISLLFPDSTIKKYILLKDSKFYSKISNQPFLNKHTCIAEVSLDKLKFNKLMDKIAELEKKEDFSEIVLQTSASGKKLEDLITLLYSKRKDIFILSSQPIPKYENLPIKELSNVGIYSYFINARIQDGLRLFIKRAIDFLFSLILLIIFTPVILLLSAYIMILDFGSPIISIQRTGIYGKEFKMFKLRTMKRDSHDLREELEDKNTRTGPLFKIENDPRVLDGVDWIRKFSLDELPQLLNVLKGDMSIVGPRPLFKEDLVNYKNEELIRLTVMPGITGLLQISDRESEDFNTWVYYDLKYMSEWSIALDIKIMLLTPYSILFQKGS